jgi:hypothetical protein
MLLVPARKAGVPRERAATMTDAVKMRMVIPFQFEKPTKFLPTKFG